MMRDPVVWRVWYVPIIITAISSVLLLLILRASGVLSPDPLVQTHVVLALKWGLDVAFFLQLPFAWRDHRRWYLSEASLRDASIPGSVQLAEPLRMLSKEDLIGAVIKRRIKLRCARMLGNVTGAICMLVGLYVILKSTWLLAAILAYAAVTAFVFRPKYPDLLVIASQKS